MDLLPTEEQQQIIDSAAHFLEAQFPVSRLLQSGSPGATLSSTELQQVAALGWLGIGLDEEFGGVGYGQCEEALLFIELGSRLMSPALLAATLAARIVSLAGPASALAPILEGTARVAIASARPGKATCTGNLVSGEFFVFECSDADYVLVADESGAVLLDPGALTLGEAEPCIDPTLQMNCASAVDAAPLAYVATAQENLFGRGALLCSALLLGIAEATLQRSVDFAKEREQYGQAIGSFQAIKHYCAEMAIHCEAVRAMVYHTSITLQQGDATGLFDISTSKAMAEAAAKYNANTAVQIHGGMGFTQEMDIHLFVKRAQVLGTLFGGERHHLAALLQQQAPD